jgi:hypothetical protein
MLRDELAPRFRSLGLRGSGQRFVLPDDHVWRVVAIQRSKWNRADSVEFTVNLFRVSRADWAAYRTQYDWASAEPSGSVVELVGERVRLGQLLAAPVDRWWSLTTRTDPAVVAEDVVMVFAAVGLRWLAGEPSSRPVGDQTS